MTEQSDEFDPVSRVAALEQELRSSRVQADARLVQAELKAEAIRANIIDLDCLKLLDGSALKLSEEGTVPEAAAAIAGLKRDKPWLFSKPNSSHPAAAPRAQPPVLRKAKDMSFDEWRAARERLLKGR